MASQVLNDCAIPPPHCCYCALITRRCLYVDVVNATWYALRPDWRPLLGNELFDKSDEFEKPNIVYCFGVGDVGPLSSGTVCAFVKGKNLRKAKRHNNITETWHLRAVYTEHIARISITWCYRAHCIASLCEALAVLDPVEPQVVKIACTKRKR